MWTRPGETPSKQNAALRVRSGFARARGNSLWGRGPKTHRNKNVGTSFSWLACEGFRATTYQVGRRDPVLSGWEKCVVLGPGPQNAQKQECRNKLQVAGMRRIQVADLSGWAERPCPFSTETTMSEQAACGWHAKDSVRLPIRLGGETLSRPAGRCA